MVEAKTRNILMMLLLMVLALVGAVPVVLLISGLFVRTGTTAEGGIVSVAWGLGTLTLQIILGLVVFGIVAIGILLFRRRTPLE